MSAETPDGPCGNCGRDHGEDLRLLEAQVLPDLEGKSLGEQRDAIVRVIRKMWTASFIENSVMTSHQKTLKGLEARVSELEQQLDERDQQFDERLAHEDARIIHLMNRLDAVEKAMHA